LYPAIAHLLADRHAKGYGLRTFQKLIDAINDYFRLISYWARLALACAGMLVYAGVELGMAAILQ
jgi:hypothetical protein